MNYSKDDIKRIKNSISKIGYQPLVVRRKGDIFQLCSNPEIFEALKLIKKETDTIDYIIRDITEQQGKELALASIVSKTDLSSKDSEILVRTIFDSGGCKSHAEFANKISKSDTYVINKCHGAPQRLKLFGPDGTSDHVSTETLRLIRPMSDDEQKLFCDRILEEKIKASEVKYCVKFLNSKDKNKEYSVPKGIREAVLNGDVYWRDAKRIYESRQPGIKAINDAMSEYHKIDTYQGIIESEKPNYTSKPFRLLGEFTNTITKASVVKISDKIQIEQVKRDLRIAGTQIFHLLYKLDVITKKQYNQICTISKVPHEQVKKLKEDGHIYFLPDAWLSNDDKKLKDRINKILNGIQEPLLR